MPLFRPRHVARVEMVAEGNEALEQHVRGECGEAEPTQTMRRLARLSRYLGASPGDGERPPLRCV